MKLRVLGSWVIAGVVLITLATPALAQRVPRDFNYSFEIIPPIPPMPPMPPLPPFPMMEPFQIKGGVAVNSEVGIQQEVFRSLLRNVPDRALDLAAERLKADPGDPVVLANLSAIASITSTKAQTLMLSIAKTSTNLDARRNAVSAISRSRNDKEGLALLEDLYNTSADNVDMRRTVVSSIGRMSDPRAVSVLARIARTDADMTIRRTAVQHLGNRNEVEANKVLEELLKEMPRRGGQI